MNELDENTVKNVSMGQKIAFGFGMLANQMFPAALQIFMVILVQDLGFPPFLWGLIFSYQDFLMLLPILSWDLFRIIPSRNGVEGDNTFL